ncbi:MAG: Na+/H+ antiporter [Candidatus Velthaea sp.]|jgi:CPA1 family monovalent cation:H+ antiporter
MTAGALLTSLLTAIVVLALAAKKIGVPYPVVFVIGGVLLGFIPGTPAIVLEPDLVFLLFLPPLIFGDGWTTDVRTFLRYKHPILWLAIGLVLFTSVCVAYAAYWLIGFPLALGFVLGAILSPTDAVATDAIAEELNLPRRLAAIVNGESLVNDASGLVIYAFAVAAVLTGTFSLGLALLQFVYVVVLGLAIGIGGGAILARVIMWIRRSGLSDELISVSISLVTPFALYESADVLHASGVLAALSGGMMLSRKSSQIFDADSRIAASAVWNLLFFTFNGAAFVLIGLQLRSLVGALTVYPPWTLAGWSLGIAAVVVLARYVWVFPVARLRRMIWPRIIEREGPAPPWQVLFILGTAGMRGVVSLAAALALPVRFPYRDLILFIVFVVIVVTLVGQGLLMPVLIRRWNVVDTDDTLGRDIALARVRMAEAVRARMRELEATLTLPQEWEVIGRLGADYDQRIAHLTAHADGSVDIDLDASQHEIEGRFRREAYDAERRTLLELRRAGTIADEAYRRIEWQIDLAESRLE